MAEATAAGKLIAGRDKITDATAALFTGSVKIPERFIRTDEVQAAGEVVGEGETFDLPVVDMASLLDPELSALETARLGSACREWGFFQLTNHGVEEAAIQQIKDGAAQFFSLPLETKNTVAVRGDGIQGFGHHFGPGNKLDWAECLLVFTQPVHGRNMEFWPAKPPTHGRRHIDARRWEYPTLESWLRHCTHLQACARLVLRGDRQTHKVPAGFHGDGPRRQPRGSPGRLLRRGRRRRRRQRSREGAERVHAPIPAVQAPGQGSGHPPHTDTLGLTFLLHVDDTPGLQIKRGGRWFPVRPLPGALVVNVGDVLEVLTNGAYASVQHRVVPDAEKGRTTVAMFHDAYVDGMVTPLPELLRGGEARPRYRSVGKLEYDNGSAEGLAKGRRFVTLWTPC